jgi:hypothetical protein
VADDRPNLTPTLLFWALGIQLILGGLLVWQASTGFALFGGGGDDASPATTPPAKSAPAAATAAAIPRPKTDRFDAAAAMEWARRQVALGPRPAGSEAQRAAADFLMTALPNGHFVDIGDGLRNIEGSLPGRGEPILLVAHYDTTPVEGYVGANNSAAGVGAVIELATALQRDQKRTDRPIRFLLTDGEEAPTYPVTGDFYEHGLRGSKAAARTIDAGDVIVLDFIAQKNLRIEREAGSDPILWHKLRRAARRVGVGSVFPDATRSEIQDDHTPFARAGMRAIDLIDFDYPCWQKPCDTMDQLSTRSLDASGEAVLQLTRQLRRAG